MSAAMAAARAAGLMSGELPPRKVGRRAMEAVSVDDGLSEPAFEAAWFALHVGYGAAAGVAYELAQRRLRLREPWPAGPLFGAALWAAGYAGWLPVFGLHPPPHRDRGDRAGMLVVHHLLYGAATAEACRRLRGRAGGARAGLPARRLDRVGDPTHATAPAAAEPADGRPGPRREGPG
jgi:hypothetical protein